MSFNNIHPYFYKIIPFPGNKFLCLIFGWIIILICLCSCTENQFTIPWEVGIDSNESVEFSLSFNVKLDTDLSSRANTTFIEGDIDNYIDTDNMFQVLFFDSNDNFLFEATQKTISKTGDNNGQWYVTIPFRKNLYPSSNDFSIASLKAQLEKEDFKIAVLANWQQYNKETKSTSAYIIDWGWNQSILNSSSTDLKTVNDLHHLVYDNYYVKKSNNAYSDIISEDGLMGPHTNWVKFRDVNGDELLDNNGETVKAWHLSYCPNNSPAISENAYTWIRNNWDPLVDKEFSSSDGVTAHGVYRHYSDLWKLWVFGASFNDTKIPYSALGVIGNEKAITDISIEDHDYVTKWKIRNGNEFAINPENSENPYWVFDNHCLNNRQANDGLEVIADELSTADETIYVRSFNGTTTNRPGYYGLILPAMSETSLEPDGNGHQREKSGVNNYVHFTAPGTGKLRILFSSIDNNDATLVVQRGSNWEMSFKTTSGTEVMEIGPKNDNTKVGNVYKFTSANDNNYSSDYTDKVGYTIKITGAPEDIILYSLENPVIVYAIEYVCDDYLSGTDREGVLPSKNNPIPMYGIQQFKGIDDWGSQAVLNLSVDGTEVALIRSLAKVELYLSSGREYPQVYIRSMNRMARNETMDVSTSTYDNWKVHESTTENNCEWFRIMEHGASLNGVFSEWNNWFFGSWASWWNGLKGKEYSNPPHLFNPDVERSDFCHFIKDKNYDDGTYHRYVLYLPDKSISDPNTVGDLASTPKVCHIEYRNAQMSSNLDDNNCYRIYFTNYNNIDLGEINETIKTVTEDGYDSYESNNENLSKHWPIMRNHIYRFYVGGNTPQEIRVNVVPFGYDVKRTEW